MKETFERHRDVATEVEKEQVWGAVWERLHARGSRLLLAVASGVALAVMAALLWPHSPERPPVNRIHEPSQHGPAAALDDGQVGPTASRTNVEPNVAAGSHDEPSSPPEAEVSPPAKDGEPAEPRSTPEPVYSNQGSTPEPVRSAPAHTPVQPESTVPRPADPAPLYLALRPGRARIVGSVRDTTGKAIPFANVLVLGTSWGAMTNDSGGFVIPNVPPGRYRLKAMIIGYGPELAETKVNAGEEAQVDFALNQVLAGQMDLVEITASRQRVRLKSTQMSHDVREMTGLKAGVVARGGELHFRGGRPSEVRHSAGPNPTPAPPVIPYTGGTKLPNDEVYDAMFFEHYGVNPLVPTEEDSLSTFGVDVDTGSYTIARRYIELGHLPPKDAVRVEEFVNFFDQGYPTVAHEDFRILIDGAPSPFGPGYHLLRIGLKAREPEHERRAPVDLIFAVDASGSMQREDRLGLVQRALGILLDRLNDGDRVGIVAYQTHAWVVLEPTPISKRAAIRAAVDRLTAGGSTNAEAGLNLAYEMARRTRRVPTLQRIILCADGVANEGNTGPESILATVRREADEGITLTTVGFGMGNYNDVLLEQLADRGDGSYHYIDDLQEATRLFDGNLGAMIETIAREAKVQVTFDPRRVTRYRLLGFENRDVADKDFRNDRVDAGEIGAGHEVTALYEVKLAHGTRVGRIATVELRYALPANPASGAPEVRELSASIDASDLRSSFEEAAPRLRLDAVVVEFAEILRKSYWAKGSLIADLVPLTARLSEELAVDRAVVEFHQLVTRAAGLSEHRSPDEPADTLPGIRPE